MCQQFSLIRELSATRYTAQCEHGTVHLRWEYISIHLSPTDFLALCQLVADVRANQINRIGKLRLGIGNVILEFQTEDGAALLELLQRTAVNLNLELSPLRTLCPQHSVRPTIHSLN